MNKHADLSKILVLTAAGLIFASQPVYASISYHNRGRHHDRHHSRHDRHDRYHRPQHHQQRHYPAGTIIWELPHGVISISVGGQRYYHHDGYYFRKHSVGYKVVTPPRGACLSRLPDGYEVIYVKGIPYYTFDGVYYKDSPQGFVIVEEPNRKVFVSQAEKSHEAKGESITVNIPNSKGGYTPVNITKTENGFVGPQGEFYPEFPQIAKLKVIYGF